MSISRLYEEVAIQTSTARKQCDLRFPSLRPSNPVNTATSFPVILPHPCPGSIHRTLPSRLVPPNRTLSSNSLLTFTHPRAAQSPPKTSPACWVRFPHFLLVILQSGAYYLRCEHPGHKSTFWKSFRSAAFQDNRFSLAISQARRLPDPRRVRRPLLLPRTAAFCDWVAHRGRRGRRPAGPVRVPLANPAEPNRAVCATPLIRPNPSHAASPSLTPGSSRLRAQRPIPRQDDDREARLEVGTRFRASIRPTLCDPSCRCGSAVAHRLNPEGG